jgi:hypothetical protein
MRPKTAAGLLAWALLCAGMAWWSWATGATAQKYLRESARGRVHVLLRSGSIDQATLARESAALGLTPPGGVQEGQILNWITDPQARDVDRMFVPQTWAWGATAGVCAVCGLASLRRGAPGRAC